MDMAAGPEGRLNRLAGSALAFHNPRIGKPSHSVVYSQHKGYVLLPEILSADIGESGFGGADQQLIDVHRNGATQHGQIDTDDQFQAVRLLAGSRSKRPAVTQLVYHGPASISAVSGQFEPVATMHREEIWRATGEEIARHLMGDDTPVNVAIEQGGIAELGRPGDRLPGGFDQGVPAQCDHAPLHGIQITTNPLNIS